MTSNLAPESAPMARARAARHAAVSALGEAELLAMADGAPVGLFASVGDFGIVLANQRMCEITGRPLSRLLGDAYRDMVHPDDAARVEAAVAKSVERTGELSVEYRIVRPDGEVRWVAAHAVRVRSDPPPPTSVGSLVDVTEVKRVEAALRDSEARFRAIVEEGFDVVTILDRERRVKYASPAARRVGRFEQSQNGQPALSFIHDDDVDALEAYYEAVVRGEHVDEPVTARLIAGDGSIESLEVIARDLYDDPAVEGLVIVSRVVTDRVEAEAALRFSEARLRDQASILEMIATSSARADTLAEICRMVESQLDGARCTILLIDEERNELVHGAAPSFPSSFLQALDGSPIHDGPSPCANAAATGETVIVDDIQAGPESRYTELAREHDIRGCWSTPVLAASDGGVIGTFATYLSEPRRPTAAEEAAVDSVVQLAAIAIERTQFEAALAHQAHHDPLTSLPNRTLFGELLEHALRRAQRTGTAVAVLFMDLDRFKVVNDSLGHDAGDELLAALGQRLANVLRPGDVVARFGGDEFTVLCEDLEPGDADRPSIGVAERLIDALRAPFMIGGEDQFVSASVGIAISTTGRERPEALLRDADAAMYRAKDRGKGRCEVFDEEMRDRVRQRHDTENALHRAVAGNEFRVLFQPMVALRDGVCVGVEALARWQHPERGLLNPRDFLPTAEETGLIVPIGAWLLEESCRRAVEWCASPHVDGFRLAVNLSGRQLVHSDLADLVAGVLSRTGLPPDALCIEITETTLMDDLAAGVGAVKALKALGVRVSIDDFGTGYSALGYLRQFPIDDVKIDRTFVERLGTDPEDAAIVSAVVSLGHALGVTVTGEGVETPAQLEMLRALGVDAAQGYLIAPPQPAADLTPQLLRRSRWI